MSGIFSLLLTVTERDADEPDAVINFEIHTLHLRLIKTASFQSNLTCGFTVGSMRILEQTIRKYEKRFGGGEVSLVLMLLASDAYGATLILSVFSIHQPGV